VYPFHFSDGDNWSSRGHGALRHAAERHPAAFCNQFCYGQVKSAYGSGQFKKDLDTAFRATTRS
jgi:uncharacterized sporulation protein YeaH/YhbH (DUF444 family)